VLRNNTGCVLNLCVPEHTHYMC